MPPIRSYIGLFFGALAAIFLLFAVRRSLQQAKHVKPVKAFLRVGLIFAAVSLVLLLLNERHE